MTQKYVFVSGKGGTGKSTCVAHLGAALAGFGKRVLLLDMDMGLRCLDTMLELSERVVFDMGDVMAGRCRTADAVLPVPKIPGLSLVPAALHFMDVRPEDFSSLFEPVMAQHDFVLIDSPAGLDVGVDFSVRLASKALVVATPDRVSIQDAARVSGALEHYDLAEKRLIINRLHPRYVRQGDSPNIDQIIDKTQLQLIGVVPLDSEIAVASLKGGISMGDTPGGDAFRRIAKRLTGERLPLGIQQ